ncbi:hypothetical protein BKA64DRAFT_765194 [Cadophora sp. MPI-SDFR-AT-0126]|nr:hypothetical protein BKA64DRAFT_765194 [Leotiomycetes sp. MPI-SDFR-AT-0126]
MPRFRFPKHPLREIQDIFGVQENNPRDVVLVSLDLEVNRNHPQWNRWNEISQIGVSFFDTRSLSSPYPASPQLDTQHFIIGGHKRLAHPRTKFYFGNSQHIINQKDVNKAIRDLLQIPDETSPGNYRDVILLAHGLSTDLAVCAKRGLVLEDLATIVGLLDTTYLATEVLGMRFQLVYLLRILGLPFQEVHNAGNDANYALRVLLVLSYYGLKPDLVGRCDTLEYFKALGFNPLPDTTRRNAKLRSLKLRCADYTLHALETGSLTFFEGF